MMKASLAAAAKAADLDKERQGGVETKPVRSLPPQTRRHADVARDVGRVERRWAAWRLKSTDASQGLRFNNVDGTKPLEHNRTVT